MKCEGVKFWYLVVELRHLVSEQQLDVVQRQLNLSHPLLHLLHLPLPLILTGGEKGGKYYPIIWAELIVESHLF